MVSCSRNYFIRGFQVRYQDWLGQAVDDNSLNGLRIQCINPSNGKTEIKQVYEGTNGEWKEWNNATTGALINGFQVQFEDSCGATCDDTALNGIKMFEKAVPVITNKVWAFGTPVNTNSKNIIASKEKWFNYENVSQTVRYTKNKVTSHAETMTSTQAWATDM
jgi:hypothetical protein